MNEGRGGTNLKGEMMKESMKIKSWWASYLALSYVSLWFLGGVFLRSYFLISS